MTASRVEPDHTRSDSGVVGSGLFDENAPEFEWVGINSRGQGVGGRGRLGRTVALWTERKFVLGWSKLEIRRVGGSAVVAKIEKNADGRRTWWAES